MARAQRVVKECTTKMECACRMTSQIVLNMKLMDRAKTVQMVMHLDETSAKMINCIVPNTRHLPVQNVHDVLMATI